MVKPQLLPLHEPCYSDDDPCGCLTGDANSRRLEPPVLRGEEIGLRCRKDRSSMILYLGIRQGKFDGGPARVLDIA